MSRREPTLRLLELVREADVRVDPRDVVYELRVAGHLELAWQLDEALRRREVGRRKREARLRAHESEWPEW